MLALAEAKAGPVGNAETLGQFLDDEEIGAHGRWRLDHLGAKQDVLMAAAAIEIVMFEKHRGGQDDVGELGRVGHELLVHGDEKIIAQETLALPAAARARH